MTLCPYLVFVAVEHSHKYNFVIRMSPQLPEFRGCGPLGALAREGGEREGGAVGTLPCEYRIGLTDRLLLNLSGGARWRGGARWCILNLIYLIVNGNIAKAFSYNMSQKSISELNCIMTN